MPVEHRLRPREMVTGNVLVGSFAVNKGLRGSVYYPCMSSKRT